MVSRSENSGGASDSGSGLCGGRVLALLSSWRSPHEIWALLSLSGCSVHRHWKVVDIERAGACTVDFTCHGELMGNGSAFAENATSPNTVPVTPELRYLLRLDPHRCRIRKCR